MVLPAFTPAGSINPAVRLLPMNKQKGITNGNRQFNFAGKISSLVQA